MSDPVCNNCINIALCYIPNVYIPDTDLLVAWCSECWGCTYPKCNDIIINRVYWDIQIPDEFNTAAWQDVCQLHSQENFIPNANPDATIVNVRSDSYVYPSQLT